MPRPPSFSPELMNTFVTIVRTEGDATVAAEVLRINQPSMSKRLAFLQHAGRILRKPWIERIGKSWHLTEEGRRVLPAVEELVHRYRLLTEALDEVRPEVVFSCGPSAAAGFVRDAVREFRLRLPNATFRVSVRPGVARVEGVANGSLDLACVRLSESEILEHAHRPLYMEELCDDTLVLVGLAGAQGRAEFLELSDKTIPPKALTHFPLIVPESACALRRDFDRRCRDVGIQDRLRVAIEVGPWTTALSYVRDGVGIAIVPRSATAGQSGLAVKPMPGKLATPNTVRLICRKRHGTDELDLTEAARDFVKVLREASRTNK